MLGAIAGDIIGSRFERFEVKKIDPSFALFTRKNRFTDDTVLTVAIAHALLEDRDYEKYVRHYYHRYPNAGYGGMFKEWVKVAYSKPYGSYGNGGAMRVSPVPYTCDTIQGVAIEAKRSSDITHNHPEGVKGAQAIAHAIFLAYKGYTQAYIKADIEKRFEYVLDGILNAHHLGFDTTSQGSVPQALVAFLEADSFEDSMRRAVAMGGDVDTIAAMAGGISEAYFGLPERIHHSLYRYLPREMIDIIVEFQCRFINFNYHAPTPISTVRSHIRDTVESLFCE